MSSKSVVIWGIHPVMEFLNTMPHACLRLFVQPSFGKKRAQAGLLRAAARCGVSVEGVKDLKTQDVPSSAVHQGVAAQVKPVWHIDFSSLRLYLKDKTLVVVCDQVTDPQNLGSIIRSSVALGAQVILLQSRRTAQITGVAAKASSGALFHIKICRVVNLVTVLNQLKKMGLWITGLNPDGQRPLWEIDLVRPTALVLGAEGPGLRRLVKETCDFLAKIPHIGPTASMNVASVAAIALYEVARQRILASGPYQTKGIS